MEQFVIFMGGTGARCAEAFAYLGACGLLGNEKTTVLLVDADQSNGNLIRSEQVLKRYDALSQALSQGREEADGFFSMPVDQRKWIVGMKEKPSFRLNELNDTKGKPNQLSADVMRALYTPSEMERVITTVGFFAHPNVGAAVMRAVLLKDGDVEDLNKQSEYGRFRRAVETALMAGEARVMLVGSLFGGTGASALPALAKDIAELCQGAPEKRKRLRIGSVLMLPYFTIRVPVKRDGQVDAEDFPQAAQCALEYYRNHSGSIFDRTYLVGSRAPAAVENMGNGGGEQKNPPMMAEWEGALAIGDFFDARDLNLDPVNHVKWTTYTQDDRLYVDWKDFSNPELRVRLSRMTIFAAFYLNYYLPQIKGFRTKGGPPNWYTNYVKQFDGTSQGSAIIEELGVFLRDFANWVRQSLLSDQVEQTIADERLLTLLADAPSRMSLEDAGHIIKSGRKALKPNQVFTAINRGCGKPLEFPTFIHGLYAQCQNRE